jgi:uncharacterized membrane protein
MKEHDTPEKNYDLERLLFFSDGVFAIAITLLVIELHPPHDWDGQIISLLNATAGKLVFYAISFIATGLFWSAHRLIYRHVERFNEPSAFLNLLFLMFVGLVPFATSLIGEKGLSLNVLMIYLGLMVAISVLAGLLWAYMSMIAKLTDPRLSATFKWMTFVRMTLSPPILSGVSLWLGLHYGLLPSLAFLIPAAYLTTRMRAKHPFGPQTEA